MRIPPHRRCILFLCSRNKFGKGRLPKLSFQANLRNYMLLRNRIGKAIKYYDSGRADRRTCSFILIIVLAQQRVKICITNALQTCASGFLGLSSIFINYNSGFSEAELVEAVSAFICRLRQAQPPVFQNTTCKSSGLNIIKFLENHFFPKVKISSCPPWFISNFKVLSFNLRISTAISSLPAACV